MQGAAAASSSTQPCTIVTCPVSRSTIATWNRHHGRTIRTIEGIQNALLLLNDASLPPHEHKIITNATMHAYAQYLLLAMDNAPLRKQLLQTIEPHLQRPLTIKELIEQFGSQVDTLETIPFFAALFSLSMDGITAQWTLEMATERFITHQPISSRVDGYSSVFISDPSIFVVDPKTLTWENLHKRELIAASLHHRTKAAQKLRTQTIRTLLEGAQKPFAFKVRTDMVKEYLEPTVFVPDAPQPSPSMPHTTYPDAGDCSSCTLI
jgi:hypothetical protein